MLVGKAQGMMVEFTAVQSDSGSTIMAFELARLAAECFGKEILFVLGDNDLRLPGDGNWDTQKTWQHVVQGKASVDDAVCRYETGSNLYISRIAASDVAVPGVVACPEMSGLTTRLRERFGLIIIDAPPIGASTNAAVLAPITDGAIVVLEAGKTRWQIARAALDQIVAHHGKVLGVVLNKQRHPVPDFIYSRL